VLETEKASSSSVADDEIYDGDSLEDLQKELASAKAESEELKKTG